MENQETHNKTILRKEIHDLKELLVTKEKEYKFNLNQMKKARDDDMINIIENSSTSVNKSAIVSQALTTLKNEFKNQVLKDNKDLNLIKNDLEEHWSGKIKEIEARLINDCNQRCDD